MATSITFSATGTAGVGTTSAGAVAPATINAGDLLIMQVTTKYGTPDTPSGWTLTSGATKSGGPGGTGIDLGDARSTVFWRIADGTEGGATVTVTCPSGNSVYAVIHRYTRTTTLTLLGAATGGAVNTATMAWTATMDATISLTTDDFVFFGSALNTDTTASSLEAFTATGAVVGALTEHNDAGTSNGDDCRGVGADGSVTSGIASAAAVYTMTCTVAAAGATVLLRLREATNSGVATITEAGDTVASAGTVAIVGALTKTEAGDTVASAGTVAIVGASAITEASDTAASAGTVTVFGVFTKTEASDTVASAGTVTVFGVFTKTEADDTVSASGTPAVAPASGAPPGTFNGLNNWPFVGSAW